MHREINSTPQLVQHTLYQEWSCLQLISRCFSTVAAIILRNCCDVSGTHAAYDSSVATCYDMSSTCMLLRLPDATEPPYNPGLSRGGRIAAEARYRRSVPHRATP
eukprot:3018444-Rhodomonas_salina.1